MINELISAGGGLLAGSALSYFLIKKLSTNSSNALIEQAKAKARVIEHEAKIMFHDAEVKAKELELKLKEKYEDKEQALLSDYNRKFEQLQEKDKELNNIFKDELKSITLEKDELKKATNQLQEEKEEINNLKETYNIKIKEADKLVEKASGMTKEEAKSIVLKRAEEDARVEIAHIVRKYEKEAKANAKKQANYIIAQATTRYAGEFAAERLINTVNLPNDELKGRIIGKEGRNIKSLEMLLGVDIIIDDTPNVIILSSFNLYRRAIATQVIEELIEELNSGMLSYNI